MWTDTFQPLSPPEVARLREALRANGGTADAPGDGAVLMDRSTTFAGTCGAAEALRPGVLNAIASVPVSY